MTEQRTMKKKISGNAINFFGMPSKRNLWDLIQALRNFEKWSQRTTRYRKTMRSENKPILHLHFTKVRLMQLIQGGNRNLRRRDDYSWVCGCSFPRDNNSEVQESLWNWVGFTSEPFSFMHVQIFLIRRCISLHWHLTPAQVPRGDNEGWLTVPSRWGGLGCEPSLYCGQPRCRWGAGLDKRHTTICILLES